MMNPEEAYKRVCEAGPYDDPTQVWYPLRWYFNEEGALCSQPWRGIPTQYPEYRRPVEVTA